MDVVNGKIVCTRTESSRSELWSALKPSRSLLEGARPYPQAGTADQLAGSYNTAMRARVDWGRPGYNTSGSTSPPHSWGVSAPTHGGHGVHAPAPSMAPEPTAGRWSRSPRGNILGQRHKQSAAAHFAAAPAYGGDSPPGGAAGASCPVHGYSPPPRLGWRWSAEAVGPGRDVRRTRTCTSSESRAMFDAEMTMFESQICRAVSDHFESLTGAFLPGSGCAAAQDSMTSAVPGVTAEESLETRARVYSVKRQVIEVGENGDEGAGANSATVKRQKSQVFEKDQDECARVAPLRCLIRKGLSVSDVGELGRIVLPKKDAEGKLPQIDTKEGKVLEMEDYSISRRWAFRYKWWINNKSRMYVLENTGEFIKHHGLKENDSFVVYEDGCGKLVVRGQKKSTPRALDCAVDASKPASSNIIENSNSDKPPTSTEDESLSRHPHHPARSFCP